MDVEDSSEKNQNRIRGTAIILLLAASVSVIAVGVTCGPELEASTLERDVDPPIMMNGTSQPGEISIDIDPVEPLPINGTVTMSMEGVSDTNMNDIPPVGVSVIIQNESVTVTNQPVDISSMEPGEAESNDDG